MHVLWWFALAGKIGSERGTVGILGNLNNIALGYLHLLDEIWIQQDWCAEVTVGLLLFANFACQLGYES
jgi:hypothetical protein